MTPQPMYWTDGYGAAHAGPPPTGYWVASDDRWYAAEFHPDFVPEPVETIEPDDSFEPAQAFDPLEVAETAGLASPHEAVAPSETFAMNLSADGQSDLPAWEQPDLPSPPDHTSAQNWSMPSPDGAPLAKAAAGDDGASDTPPPAPRPSSAPDSPEDAPASSNRTLVTAVVGIIAILGLVAAGYSLMNRDDGDSLVISDEASGSAALPTPSTVTPDSSIEASDDSTSTTPATLQSVATNDGSLDGSLDGIESCSRVDEQTLEISMTNVSDATASYLLTVAYLEADGTRVGDDTVYISSLRPGEHTVEQSYVFSDIGVDCDVIFADRYDRNGLDGMADISACSIREANNYGFIEADLTATNTGSTDVDYTVEVALVDIDNVRRGYGTAYIGRTPVGASEAGQVFTTVAYDESYRCDVIAVTRFESAQ